MRTLVRPGNFAIGIIVLLPTIVAAWLAAPAGWDAQSTLQWLGRLAGIAGFVLMLVAASVSIRIPGLDQPFGGLTELWQVHRWLGTGAFLLLLAHPLLLALSAAAVSPAAAAEVLSPPATHRAAWFGWAALVAMMVFLAPTFSFFGAPRYQLWKRLHALSALAVLLGFAHTLLLNRALPAWAWWALGALAFASIAYRLVWRKLHPGARYTITAVTPLADRVVELALERPRGQRMRFDAGQFVYLAPLDPALTAGRRQEHPYTICSAPADPQLRIAIKALGDATAALQHVRPGTDVLVDGPYGRFFEPGEQDRELWVGGGIGITPFVGRARAIGLAGAPVDIDLVYCSNDASRAYYLDELVAIAERVPGFRVWPHYFRDEGPLDAAWIAQRCEDVSARRLYACGPAPLLRETRIIRAALAIPRRRYHSEEFSFL
ncbi:MAG: ferric reductase-like transmembrane domain-containing protein [Xanthomonadaceae bacterium]|nr:ferric reductase-like transmembrane domain-containing protein [Xanthomonadaceae bacterium]